MAKTETPAGRRELVKDERAFAGRDRKCRRHMWILWTLKTGDTVAACGVCGRIKQGETMPASLPPAA